jgi:hypothetical protein
VRVLPICGLLVALAGCGASTEPADAGADAGGQSQIQPTLSSIQATVFKVGCAVSGCHDATSAQAGLVLTDAATSYAHLVNQPAFEIAPLLYPDGGLAPAQDGGLYAENICLGLTDGGVPLRVAPGDPQLSYLVWKLTGFDGHGNAIENSFACGPMPKVADGQLPDDQIAAIRQWITQGAPNN